MIGKNCLIKKFKTWRIRTQILVTQLITMIISITILGISLFLYFEGIIQILQNEAEKKFVMNFIYRQTNSQLNAYTRNLENRIQYGISAIYHINLLNQQIQNTNMSFVQNSEKCLQDTYLNGSYVLQCQYCYGIFDCSNEINYSEQYSQELLQLSSVLTQLIPIKIELDIYFTSITKNCYFSYYPGQPFGDFKPSSRQWFKNHLTKRNESEYVISEPYADYFGGVYITGTTDLNNGANNQRIGIIGVDLDFSDIHQMMQDDQQMLAIDTQGRILLSKFYTINTSQVYYLSNQSMFGFNQSDVNLILNHDPNLTQQACKIKIPQTICIENKNTGVLWYFRVKRMIGNYYAVAMYNQQAYSNYFSILSATLSTIQTKAIADLLIGLLSVILSCFIIYVGCFLILQKPIDKLINCFNKYLLQGQQINYLMFEINHHDQLDKLSEAFGRLMTRSLSNTENRKQIIDHHESESQYPINFYVNSKILDPQNKKLIQNLKRKKISTQKIIDKFFQQFRQEISSQKSY